MAVATRSLSSHAAFTPSEEEIAALPNICRCGAQPRIRRAIARAEALACVRVPGRVGANELDIPAVRAPDGSLVYFCPPAADGRHAFEADFVMDEAALAKHPALVKGYIGPGSLGADKPAGIRYLVDPRIVDGTQWVTGADQPGRHVLYLTAGRDFSADGKRKGTPWLGMNAFWATVVKLLAAVARPVSE